MTKRLKLKHKGCDVCHEPEMYRTLMGWHCLKHWEALRGKGNE